MKREDVINLMTNPIDPQTMITIIFEYIFDRTGERPQVGNITIDPYGMMVIQQNYQTAIEWFAKKLNINMLYDVNKNLIKIY